MPDPLIDAYNAILLIAENDADFGPMFTEGRRIKDTQSGWLKRYIQTQPAAWPQFRWAFGDGRDAMFSAPSKIEGTFSMENPDFITAYANIGWNEPMTQFFTATFIYETSKHDSEYQHGFENTFLTSLRRAGPKLGMPTVTSWGPTQTLRGTLTDEGVARPVTRIPIPVYFLFNGRDLL